MNSMTLCCQPSRARRLRSYVTATASLLLICLAPVVAFAEDEEWIQLFNGQDLKDWTVKIQGYPLGENFGNTFRVEDGVMKVSYDAYESFDRRFGHIFYNKPYSHYRLRVEYRFTGTKLKGGPRWGYRNSGVEFHSQDPKTMSIDQEFPIAIEGQFFGGADRGMRPTGNVCTPGTFIEMKGELVTKHCVNSSSDTFRGDQWVTAEFEIRGDESIKHFINGKLVLEYAKPQYDPGAEETQPLIKDGQLAIKSGYLALQSKSHPVEFRKVELLKLD